MYAQYTIQTISYNNIIVPTKKCRLYNIINHKKHSGSHSHTDYTPNNGSLPVNLDGLQGDKSIHPNKGQIMNKGQRPMYLHVQCIYQGVHALFRKSTANRKKKIIRDNTVSLGEESSLQGVLK